jgi:hypothetical protein
MQSCEYVRLVFAGDAIPCSTAADRDNDFYFIAVVQRLIRVTAPRHDLPILLQRNTLACKLQTREQFGTTERCAELPEVAVDGEGNHGG